MRLLQWIGLHLVALTSFGYTVTATALCPALDSTEQDALITYVAKRFNVPKEFIIISSVETVGDTCFREVHFHATNPSRTLLLYLSPNHRYLMPDLYDTHLDSQIASLKEHLETSQVLLEGNPPRRGSDHSAITIVEFVDFQCPYCKRMTDTFAAISRTTSPNDISLVYKSFPLPMHEWARDAAAIAQCTYKASPGAFWPLYDYLFARQEDFTSTSFKEQSLDFLKGEGVVSVDAIEACAQSPGIQASIDAQIRLGKSLGVTSTPTLFINGEKFEGAKSPEQLNAILQKVRSNLSKSP